MKTFSDDTIPQLAFCVEAAREVSGNDLRETPRFLPAADRVVIGWWNGRDFRRAEARLLNISRGGAAVAFSEVIEAGAEAWFCILGARLSGGVRVRVVGHDPIEECGSTRIRLQFQPRCPDDILEVALSMAPASAIAAGLN